MKKIRFLKLKIQFLKPCLATTKVEEYIKKYAPSGEPDADIPYR